MDEAGWNEFLLTHLPSFLARRYQDILQTDSPQERVKRIVHLYILLLRTMALYLVSQYLISDAEQLTDSELNELLLYKFPSPMSPDMWQRLFFTALHAYEGKRPLFFLPELYDWYWDTSSIRHQPRPEVMGLFQELTHRAVLIQGEVASDLPQTETEWKNWEQELLSSLTTLLRGVSFLSQYPLIRVLTVDASSYRFELHQGLTVVLGQESLPSYKLRPGYFYLRKGTQAFLRLHPLLVFWGEQDEHRRIEPPDTGIYDALIYDEALRYLLATPDERSITLNNPQSLKEFLLLVFDTIDQIKRKRQEAERLTWWHLRDLCQDISQLRMATVRHKFKEKVYLPRVKTQQVFEHFLRSEKRCFVLIGKSGIGKTSFLLSLADDFFTHRNDICVLMYDGGNLTVQPSITHLISRDFANRLVLSGRTIEHIWYEIAQIEGISGRTVLLVIDALNENQQATELLRQLNELLQEPWPWLKIVFSSRPETWRTIKQRVKLAEALYYQANDPMAEETWESTSPAELMAPFSLDELPKAYAKYQEEYRLQTAYGDLSSAVRQTLQDPLNLWLVASTHQSQALPPHLKTAELIEQYTGELVDSRRLERKDLVFLERQLVPLMAREGHYANEITTADIISSGGERLYLEITSEEVLGSGRQMNQSFLNLLNAELLVRHEERRGLRVTFKYERFYDYFVGERIFELSQSHPNHPAFFLQIIGQMALIPFLWGAVRNALLQEARNRPETIVQLCFTNQQRVKEIMVSVLTSLGEDHLEDTTGLLRRLIPPEEKTSRLHQIRQFTRQTNPDSDPRTRSAGKIAVEVACSLDIPELLERASLQSDPSIRTAAVRYSYHLWRQDQEAGFAILTYLGQAATRHLIPDLAAFESVLGISLLIFFDHPHDSEVLQRLQQLWHTIIGHVLGIKESANRISKAFRSLIRERIFSLGVGVALRMLADLPDYNPLSPAGFAAFFHRNAEEKALFRRLTRYLDVEGSYNQEEMRQDYLAALRINDAVIQPISSFGLSVHLVYNLAASLPLVKDLFEALETDSQPTAGLSAIAFALMAAVDNKPSDDQLFDYYHHVVEVCQKYYTRPECRKTLSGTESPEAMHLGPSIYHYYQKKHVIPTDWLQSRIDTAFEQNNMEFFKSLLTSHLTLVAIERGKPQAALDTLALFFNRHNDEIEKLLCSLLVRMRARYPDAIDSFLEEQQASEALRLHVLTGESTERVGELIGLRSVDFLRELLIFGQPSLKEKAIRFIAQAADTKNTRTWIEYLIREVLNLIYQGEALRQAK